MRPANATVVARLATVHPALEKKIIDLPPRDDHIFVDVGPVPTSHSAFLLRKIEDWAPSGVQSCTPRRYLDISARQGAFRACGARSQCHCQPPGDADHTSSNAISQTARVRAWRGGPRRPRQTSESARRAGRSAVRHWLGNRAHGPHHTGPMSRSMSRRTGRHVGQRGGRVLRARARVRQRARWWWWTRTATCAPGPREWRARGREADTTERRGRSAGTSRSDRWLGWAVRRLGGVSGAATFLQPTHPDRSRARRYCCG